MNVKLQERSSCMRRKGQQHYNRLQDGFHKKVYQIRKTKKVCEDHLEKNEM